MSDNIAQSSHSAGLPPVWSVEPNDTDWLAWAAIICIILAVYLVFSLYAKFDDWAEHQAEGTPLAKTIPTLLGIALLYEIFPLDHFSILLPLSAILIAFMIDWRREQSRSQQIGPQLQNVGQESIITEIEVVMPDEEPPIIQADKESTELQKEGATNV